MEKVCFEYLHIQTTHFTNAGRCITKTRERKAEKCATISNKNYDEAEIWVVFNHRHIETKKYNRCNTKLRSAGGGGFFAPIVNLFGGGRKSYEVDQGKFYHLYGHTGICDMDYWGKWKSNNPGKLYGTDETTNSNNKNGYDIPDDGKWKHGK